MGGGRRKEREGRENRERGGEIERKKEASPPVHFSMSVIAESTYLIMYMHVYYHGYYTDFVHLLRHIN